MLRQWAKRVIEVALPWLVLSIVAGLAIWHLFNYQEARETDFPKIIRPFHNPLSPKAYRLAEPGDTLDRIGLYVASFNSAACLIAVISRWKNRTKPIALWPAALSLSLAATWYAASPGPTFDGWPGLGWRVMSDPLASSGIRTAVGLAAFGLIGVILVNLTKAWPQKQLWLARARELRIGGLLVVSFILVTLRQVEFTWMAPVGYWPRCCFDLGMIALGFVLLRARPLLDSSGKVVPKVVLATTTGLIAAAGVGMMTYHRPLARLHAVVPGRIYISAMPSYWGLAIEQERLHFRTIINLFDEASTQSSPYHEEELRFVRDHGLRYLGSPSDGLESDRFLDETLQLAQDPEAWPILVHCHGCMDRSPAWMGIYRFVVEGRPLDDIFAEIERHRGSRPKAIVTLQYNRKLQSRAPERFAADPTARSLPDLLAGTLDPFRNPNWNGTATRRRVVTRIDPDPNLRRP